MNSIAAHNARYEDAGSALFSNLSIALISPNERRRAAAAESASSICEFSSYLANPADQERLSQMQFDVIMVDIDGDAEKALKLVEDMSSRSKTKVVVYSSDKNPEKLMRCICAGARDFLAFPFEREAMQEALNRLAGARAESCGHRYALESRRSATGRVPSGRDVFEGLSAAHSRARS